MPFDTPSEVYKRLYPTEKKEVFGDGKFMLGYSGEVKAPIELDFSYPRRCMIICEPGGGKSYGAVHRTLDYLYLNDFLILHLQDKSGELRNIYNPNPHYIRDVKWEMQEVGMSSKPEFMPFEEEPFGWAKDSYSTYSPEVIPAGRRRAAPISFEFTDFTAEEIVDIIGLTEKEWRGDEIIVKLHSFLKSKRDLGEDLRLTEHLLDILRTDYKSWIDDPNITIDNVGSIFGRLKGLVRKGAFEGEYIRKFTDIFGKHIILDWRGYSSPYQSLLRQPERDIFLSWFLLKTIEWAQEVRGEGEKRKIVIVLDDAQDIITGHTTEGRIKYPLSLNLILTVMQELRKFEFSIILAFQGNWGKVPAEMWDMNNLIIAGRPKAPKSQNALAQGLNLDSSEKLSFLRMPLKAMRVVEGGGEEREEGLFPWFVSYPPLSEHYEV